MRLPRASMKVPPKRKGNAGAALVYALHVSRLNESPSEKEGKWSGKWSPQVLSTASMKVPPKRKGNTQ